MSAIYTVPKDWHTPATSYPTTRVGNVRTDRERYSKGFYPMSGLEDAALFQVPRGGIPVTSLQEYRDGGWHTWMVDDPPHWRAMQWYAGQAQGRVLVGGLGLGLVTHALMDNPKVAHITVVDQNRDVVELIAPQLPSRPSIVIEDFRPYYNQSQDAYDTIIVDLWVTYGIAEKLTKLYTEVMPMREELKAIYPQANIFFHGFVTACDSVWPVSERTKQALRAVAETR